MSRPQATDFPPYFARYISQVDADSLSDAVKRIPVYWSHSTVIFLKKKQHSAMGPVNGPYRNYCSMWWILKGSCRTGYCALPAKTKRHSPLLMRIGMLNIPWLITGVLHPSKKNLLPYADPQTCSYNRSARHSYQKKALPATCL